jgi:hypothetical protein
MRLAGLAAERQHGVALARVLQPDRELIIIR